MKRLMALTLAFAAFCLAPANLVAAATTTVVVTPANAAGLKWTFTSTSATSSSSIEDGQAPAGFGTGSVKFSVGPNGDDAAQARSAQYNGILLSDLTSLSYQTYVQGGGSGGQAPYLILNIDLDGDPGVEDQLFFEPVYQSGTYSGDAVPNQCGSNPNCVVTGEWQSWNALEGGWWALSAGTFGPPLVTLESYIAANPTARLASPTSGAGSLRVVTGFGAGAWDNFVGFADAVAVGVNNAETVFDFEKFSAPTAKAQCKNGGWQTFSPNRPEGPFKNQGDCVSSVTSNAGGNR